MLFLGWTIFCAFKARPGNLLLSRDERGDSSCCSCCGINEEQGTKSVPSLLSSSPRSPHQQYKIPHHLLAWQSPPLTLTLPGQHSTQVTIRITTNTIRVNENLLILDISLFSWYIFHNSCS
uniref:Uncharacterized protein n=1 Tax=Micrurus surinamensis TaxID=129470 RepID=A0A2D4NW19_MICSU